MDPLFEQGRKPGTRVEQVVDYFADAIGKGSLLVGSRLPSIRDFAKQNMISKSTVVEAYDRLVASGKIVSRAKSGFYVLAERSVLDIAKVSEKEPRDVDAFWMLRNTLQLSKQSLRPGCGWLPTSMLNDDGIRRALGSLRRQDATALTDYGEPAGYEPLRHQLQRVLANRRIQAGVNQILLTDSASQALDLAIRFQTLPGDTVLLDDPCYFNFQASLRAHRVNVVGIPFGQNGPNLLKFEEAIREYHPRVYITNSILQNPTGCSISPDIAHGVITLASKYDFQIIEDDTFGDFEDQVSTRLASLDQLNRVTYLGSFSKSLSGSVRIGFLASSMDRIEPLLDLKLATTFGNSELSARLIHSMLMDGTYRKHLDSIRQRLHRCSVTVRRDLMQHGFQLPFEYLGGPFLWATWADEHDCTRIAVDALNEDILLAPGNVFSISKNFPSTFRFNIANSQDIRLMQFLSKVRI